MLGAIVNINGRKLKVNFKYSPAIPLDPNNAEIQDKPERVDIFEVQEFGKDIYVSSEFLEEIRAECLKAVKESFYNKDV
jgi:hypothetical protein